MKYRISYQRRRSAGNHVPREITPMNKTRSKLFEINQSVLIMLTAKSSVLLLLLLMTSAQVGEDRKVI